MKQRKIVKPQYITPNGPNADFGYKIWFKPDKSTQRLSDAQSKSRDLIVKSSRSKTITHEAQSPTGSKQHTKPSQATKASNHYETTQLPKRSNDFSMSKIASTVSCSSSS